MCASYGLQGPMPEELEPMSDPESSQLINDWLQSQNGRAKITGRNARNLNPLVHVRDGQRTVDLAWWWIWYNSAGPVKFSAFNSRDDKLLQSWKRPFQQRAILPASWYIEKKVTFVLPENEPFGIAALTNTVKLDDGTDLITYSMVTREAVGEAAETWHRMPMILPTSLYDDWLNPAVAGDEALLSEAQHASFEVAQQVIAV
ncbi:MAG: SOS response-associated peptidase family protein [Canibacter sp.]